MDFKKQVYYTYIYMGSNSSRPRGLQILVMFSIKTSQFYGVSNFDPYPYEAIKISL